MTNADNSLLELDMSHSKQMGQQRKVLAVCWPPTIASVVGRFCFLPKGLKDWLSMIAIAITSCRISSY